MPLRIIGPHPFERDEGGGQKVRIGTLFLAQGVLYTQPPGVHAWQRSSFIESLNNARTADSRAPVTPDEEQRIIAESVDLVFDPDQILIRPDPERMDLAFAGDELLQELFSKRQIVFLNVSQAQVRMAIKQRGECWRLSTIPKTREGRRSLILESKVGIQGLPLYFYNRLTGTRWLTCDAFESLGALEDSGLARHLQEIADYSIRRNRLGRPELSFFATDLRRMDLRQPAAGPFEKLPSVGLRAEFERLKQQFQSDVLEAFQRDDPDSDVWSRRMIATLFLDGNETQTEEVLSGLSPEFFMQIEWLPGGRFEGGEFLFDPVFEEAVVRPQDAVLQQLCDSRAKGVIFNLIREYGDLEYINVGRIPNSLGRDHSPTNSTAPRRRRGVYLAELLPRGEREPIRRFMRLQKWGVWEHLDEGKELLPAIEESEDYTDFWLDRRLGCRQLGMALLARVVMRRLREVYTGTNERYRNRLISTTYFERDYLPGFTTDKIPLENYSRPGYAIRLAGLLGGAAVPSMIVGRSLNQGTRPVFDDGDEIVTEDADGLPARIVLGDHSGAFGEYKLPLDTFAANYARPVNLRDQRISNPRDFAQAYLAAFRDQFLHIQGDYRKRRRAFDTLFKHCKYDPNGSFAYRWEQVLRRLDQTDADALVEAIRKHIRVLNLPPG